MQLYVIRHGETEMGKNGVIATIEEPLNSTGIDQAKRIAPEIAALNISKIYVSPIQRAKDTLSYFRLSKDIPVIVENRIAERNMGIYEKIPFADLNWDMFWSFHSKEKYPNCESMEDTFKRVEDFLTEIWCKYDEDVLLVTHGGICRVIDWYCNGIPEDGHSNNVNENCKIYKYNIEMLHPHTDCFV